jgi:hypothetical protein
MSFFFKFYISNEYLIIIIVRDMIYYRLGNDCLTTYKAYNLMIAIKPKIFKTAVTAI